MRRLFAKVRNFFGRRRAEQEMVREIAAHLALLEDEFLRQGMDLTEARLAARRAYGGVEQAKELHRDARSLFWLEQMLQDLRHAWRSLSKSPGFVAVALLSLAFGIGVNTAIFTLVNGILLKKLPVPDPARIVQLTAHIEKENFHSDGFNFLSYRELRRQTSIFADVIAFWGGPAALDAEGEPNKVRLEMVTGSYFPFLSARPALGRLLDEDDDRLEGAHRVCVLGYRIWQAHFGGDPGILDRIIRIDNVPLQIVGVAAPEVVGAELQERPDIWVTTALTPEFTGHSRNQANYIWLRVMARLRPVISFREARDRLAAASPSIEAALPKNRANADAVYRIQDASHGFDAWRTELRDPLLILMGAVTLVLLVACANLANLLLARTNERHQEFAIKLSLGISRWRLLRQLLVETLLLVFSGGAVACFFSVALTRFLLTLFNDGKQYAGLHVAPDTAVVLYAFIACLVTAVVAGLYPAWQASRTDAGPRLKGAAVYGIRGSLLRRSLIVVQVSLAVVLLFGGSVFAHSLRKLKTVNLGYDIDHLLTIAISERHASQTGSPLSQPDFADILARVRRLPGVESAAISNPGMLSDIKMSGELSLNETSRQANEVIFTYASPGYFATMHMPLFSGREFAPADRKGSPPVAIINQRLASLLSPDWNPVGMHFDGWGSKSVEIIGVTGNSRYLNVREDTRPILYLAFDQDEGASWGVLEIRCRGSLASMERDVRDFIKTNAPALEVFRAAAMEMLRDTNIAQERLLAFLSSLFGTLGTALALVGIYGLISYSVTRRTREIGIRMSVGAQRSDVLWLFLRESTLLVFAGLMLGLPLALELAVFVRKMLYGVTTSDPLGIFTTLALIVLGGLLASLIPARRATRVNPVQALRYD